MDTSIERTGLNTATTWIRQALTASAIGVAAGVALPALHLTSAPNGISLAGGLAAALFVWIRYIPSKQEVR